MCRNQLHYICILSYFHIVFLLSINYIHRFLSVWQNFLLPFLRNQNNENEHLNIENMIPSKLFFIVLLPWEWSSSLSAYGHESYFVRRAIYINDQPPSQQAARFPFFWRWKLNCERVEKLKGCMIGQCWPPLGAAMKATFYVRYKHCCNYKKIQLQIQTQIRNTCWKAERLHDWSVQATTLGSLMDATFLFEIQIQMRLKTQLRIEMQSQIQTLIQKQRWKKREI